MRPDEVKNGQGGTLDPTSSYQAAAANVVRTQISHIYEKNENKDSIRKPFDDTNPYDRIHDKHTLPLPEQWEKYHTAWQNYYRNYYEGYYSHHYSKSHDPDAKDGHKQKQQHEYFSENNTYEGPADKDEEIFNLRQHLLGKVQHSTQKIRKSHHFIPIISGVVVVLIFLFLQYNQIIISNAMAYVSPGSIDRQNIVINPGEIAVSAEPRLIVPKINVDAPVIYDVANDFDTQMAAMANGVVHFAIPGANSHPGQIGNTVLAGHSSSELFDNGDYKFIFVRLDKLAVGDMVYANYMSKRYTYVVTKKEVVNPNDVSKLIYETNKPILTLVTCTPIGTAKYRLLVTAEQISPDPSAAESAPDSKTNETKTIPGSSKGFFDWLLSGRW